MSKKTSTRNREKLSQLSTEELVEIILTQQEVIEHLKQEIGNLKASRDLDSKNSSKPPSSDLLKKSEKKKEQKSEQKKKPGGQPGHRGKTRKGFARIDRYEVLKASNCHHCGQDLASAAMSKIEKRAVAQLVAKPIEIVEYQRLHLECPHCQQNRKY